MKTIRHKFNAVRCESDGKKFPSLLEKNYYNQLVFRQKAGDIVFFLRQISFDLPGNVHYRADFQIFNNDGTIDFVDTKGKDTPISIAKRKMVEELYPVKIKIVTRV